MNKAPIIEGAVMLDKILGEIQKGLTDNIGWLDVAFGKAQRLSKMVDGRKYVTPNVYCGGWNGRGENDYLEVSPDSHIGNFSFFDIEDPQTIEAGTWARHLKVPFALIVWFDLSRIYDVANNRNTEWLKADVLRVLSGRDGWHLGEGRVTVARIYERAENVYRGFTLSEVDNQFLMHPYGAMRFEGIIEFEELCQE